MSTRSGKRIHKSLHETTVSPDITTKSATNARSKRSKENCEELSVSTTKKAKRRDNYVIYPTDDGSLEPPRLRRRTLKDHNVNTITDDSADTSKTTRLTRQSKKNATSSQLLALEPVEKAKTKKKKAKISESRIPRKKSKKKKKNSTSSGSIIVEDVADENEINKSNRSEDSFHSAAGSPVHDIDEQQEDINEEDVPNIKNPTSFEKTVKGKRKYHVEQKADVLKSLDVSNKVDEDIETPDRETIEKGKKKKRRPSLKKSSFNKTEESINNLTNTNIINSTFEVDENTNKGRPSKCVMKLDTPDRKSNKDVKQIKNISNSTFDQTENMFDNSSNIDSKLKNTTFEIYDSSSNCITSEHVKDFGKATATNKILNEDNPTENRPSDCIIEPNQTIERPNSPKTRSLDSTFDKEVKLDSTYDKNPDSKTSLISSDNTESNLTFDKSSSRISITSDESKTENILNTTPVLIESSLDDSQLNKGKMETKLNVPVTPLIREGTFTKDDQQVNPDSTTKTPIKQASLSSPGRTPFPSNNKSSSKRVLNRTHSIEKPAGSSSMAAPKLTRVMFCSPVNSPMIVEKMQSKVIKSSLKGSNKSFVFDDSGASHQSGRKRSLTQSDTEERGAWGAWGAKRKRLAAELQLSVNRLSRPRSSSAVAGATAKPVPSPKKTPSKSNKDSKASRCKLPNFAALHRKQFERMESLDQCQKRRAERAKQLLIPTGGLAGLDRSPKTPSTSATVQPQKTANEPKEKPKDKNETPTKIKPVSERPGYTRFGFKLNLEVNPFSITKAEKPVAEISTAEKPVIAKPVTVKPVTIKPVTDKHIEGKLKPNGALKPSLKGTTVRKEAAKQTILREKRLAAQTINLNRSENRTFIKGVRCNRRFEFQMLSRNLKYPELN